MPITTKHPASVLNALRALAWMVAHGYVIEVSEPEPRGRKGPDHKALRLISIRVPSPATFDSVRLEMEQRYPNAPVRQPDRGRPRNPLMIVPSDEPASEE